MHSFNKFSSQRAHTLAELLVSMTIGLIVTGLTLSSSLINRYTISQDVVRTRLNQNLRGSIDMIGLDVRVAGENLNTSFPAIEITDASGENSDKLVLRRNLLEEVLPLCSSIIAGSSITELTIAQTTATPGCSYSGQTHNYTAWESYRTNHGGAVKAFLYDTVNRRGEFFTYQSGISTGTQYRIVSDAHTWQYAYSAGTSAIYMLEEWEYRRENELLKLIVNRDSAAPFNVSFGVTDIQFRAVLSDASIVNSFDNTNDWTTIAAIEASLTGSDNFSGKTMQRTVLGRYFPRNILSN